MIMAVRKCTHVMIFLSFLRFLPTKHSPYRQRRHVSETSFKNVPLNFSASVKFGLPELLQLSPTKKENLSYD